MDDLLADFLTETSDALEELDNDLVHLEQKPNDAELLSKIFRLVHTIKGTCGFLGLPKLEKIAHHAENVLGRFRDGDLDVTAEYVSLIFESIDTIKFILGEIAANGAEPDTDSSALIRKLDRAYESDQGAPEAASIQEPEPIPEQEPVAEEHSQDMDIVAAGGGGTAANATANGGGVPTGQSLRVNVDVLEDLMTMVSELVLTRNQLLQILRMQGESDFTAPLQRLNHVVSDLQEGVMKTRMQPIGNAWAKLPRIVRDLSIELGKKVDLHMSGQDTELDRQVLELIKDPLTHMVRNSADHGIEDPQTRKAMGKPETGSIRLEACHEGGHIIIRIADDGKGLALEKIKRKILDNNLASADELSAMSPQQIQQFIFKAGFSTAEAVTAVSGRGVGMDVVRTNIERIGGTIELHSVEGEGSVFTIKIPLTLAIVSALIVGTEEERFAIPQLAVRELVMAGSSGENRIEHIHGAPVFRLRNRLLPLMTLGHVLGIAKPPLVSAPTMTQGQDADAHEHA
ncbi:MAG: chemotaxis protein CheA [Alphaproteobacteria bacterium]